MVDFSWLNNMTLVLQFFVISGTNSVNKLPQCIETSAVMMIRHGDIAADRFSGRAGMLEVHTDNPHQ